MADHSGVFALSSFATRSDRRNRRECGGCKVHFSSQLSSCPNCGKSREQSVAPQRRFEPGSPSQPRS